MTASRLLTLCVAIAPAPLAAQYTEPPPPAAYVLTDVTVVQSDGRRTSGVTIVVRGGLIEAMGPNVTPPDDAQVLEGDSLIVYPGIVDAHGKAAHEFPEVEVDRTQVGSWALPRPAQGFQPHRRVVDHLTATSATLRDQRTKGIVAAGVHPEEGLLAGRSALIMHRQHAAASSGLVLAADIGVAAGFRGAQGGYPGTLFAMMSFFRQQFDDARRHGQLWDAYRRDPRGLTAPEWDPDYAVLRDLMAGTLPLYFSVDGAEDIRRVLSLAESYRFRPVIVGGAEAWRVADQLRAGDVPVLVSLDFPEPRRWKPPKEGEEQTEPLDAAAEREKRELEDRYSNAGRLAAAGVRFALTSGGGKADVLKNTRKVIEHGLSEDAALRALTATPAGLLGAPHLARIEPGYAATFVVTDGPLFGADTRIAYTFVEGALEKGPARRPAGPTEAPLVDVTGTWEMRLSSEMGPVDGTANFTQEGATFTGSMRTEFGVAQVRDGVVSGNKVTFVLVFEMGGQSMSVDFDGEITGDEGSGSASSQMGSMRWTARRTTPGAEVR